MTKIQNAKETYDAAMDSAREDHRKAVQAAKTAYNNATAEAWMRFIESSGGNKPPSVGKAAA